MCAFGSDRRLVYEDGESGDSTVGSIPSCTLVLIELLSVRHASRPFSSPRSRSPPIRPSFGRCGGVMVGFDLPGSLISASELVFWLILDVCKPPILPIVLCLNKGFEISLAKSPPSLCLELSCLGYGVLLILGFSAFVEIETDSVLSSSVVSSSGVM